MTFSSLASDQGTVRIDFAVVAIRNMTFAYFAIMDIRVFFFALLFF